MAHPEFADFALQFPIATAFGRFKHLYFVRFLFNYHLAHSFLQIVIQGSQIVWNGKGRAITQ